MTILCVRHFYIPNYSILAQASESIRCTLSIRTDIFRLAYGLGIHEYVNFQ